MAILQEWFKNLIQSVVALGLTIGLIGCGGSPFQSEKRPPANITEHYKTLYKEYEDRITEIEFRDKSFLYLTFQASHFDKIVSDFQDTQAKIESLAEQGRCGEAVSKINMGSAQHFENIHQLAEQMTQVSFGETLGVLSGQLKAYTPANQKAMRASFEEMQQKIQPGLKGVLSLVEYRYNKTYTVFRKHCGGIQSGTQKI